MSVNPDPACMTNLFKCFVLCISYSSTIEVAQLINNIHVLLICMIISYEI